MPTTDYSEFIRERTFRWPIKKAAKEGLVIYAARLESRGIPVIFDLNHLTWHTGIEARTIANAVLNTNQYYRSRSIPKRRGGFRKLSVPRPYLAALQRWILDEILGKLPAHPSAFAFVEGASIVKNAKAHLGAERLLKIDLKDFFGSIRYEAVYDIFSKLGYSPKISYYLSRLCTLEGSLPQGAPSSPCISNLIMALADIEIFEYASRNNLVYTRYADDICISGKSIPEVTFSYLTDCLNKYGFEIANDKTVLSDKGQKKIVTGISISEGKLKLPREQRRRLRQEIFYIRSNGLDEHIRARGITDPIYKFRLRGMIEFWLSVEPDNPTAKLGKAILA